MSLFEILSSISPLPEKIHRCILSNNGEIIQCSVYLCTKEMASYLSPSRGHNMVSPLTVVRIAWHCCRVLRQTGTLCRLSYSVKPCFPHWCTLPQSGAPLVLGTHETPTAATVQSVHLWERRQEESS